MIDVDKEIEKIPLTREKYALVDALDYVFLMQWKWHYDDGYAKRTAFTSKGPRAVFMHKIVFGSPDWQQVDHIDQNTLNNCKSNLRNATHRENMINRKKRPGCTSIYKGVSWCKPISKWKAAIGNYGKKICLGFFVFEEDAASAYNKAAKMYHKEFACLNVLNPSERKKYGEVK